MQPVRLPAPFEKSCLDSRSYPETLLHRNTNTYRTALELFRIRLDSAESGLFVDDEDDVEVPFRDFHDSSPTGLQKLNVHDSMKLINWLGIEFQHDPSNPSLSIVSATKQDPKSRFIYIYGDHSRARLKITRNMLAQVFTFHQVMPVYLDFISVFGAQTEPRDRRFSGFREQTTLAHPPRGLVFSEIGRSGRQYQICYNLKTAALKSEHKMDMRLSEWSVQPAAFHHQFDIVNGRTLWIVTKGNRDIQERYKELTGKDGRLEDRSFGTVEECFRSSLAAHLTFCHWSTENWRWFILWLENVMEEETCMAILGPRGPGHAHRQYTPHDLQGLQRHDDKTNEVIADLEANVEIMSSLCKFYTGLMTNNSIPQSLKDAVELDINAFTAQVENMISDFKMQIARANLLVKITKDRKELVTMHLQSQAAERMESLNLNMEKDAIVMRIVTIVTLLYLPATFVSTFFSTDIVKYQDQGGGPPNNGVFSNTALYRWLQVTLPLTAMTIAAAVWALKRAENQRWQQEYTKEQKKWPVGEEKDTGNISLQSVINYHNFV